jgi:hypothetical protein
MSIYVTVKEDSSFSYRHELQSEERKILPGSLLWKIMKESNLLLVLQSRVSLYIDRKSKTQLVKVRE